MKKAVLLLIIPFLASCTGMRGAVSDAELQSGRNVAIASLLGNSFHVIRVGTTVFGNASYEAPVPEWNIDGATEELIVSRIARRDSRRATPLKRDPGLAARFGSSWSFFNNGFNYDEVLKLAQEQGFDTLIVVQPTPYSNAKFHKPGYGFYERTLFGSSNRCVYSLFTIDVFAVSSRRKLAWEWGFPCNSGEDALDWKDDFAKYTSEERASLRRRAEESVRGNVLKALTSLGYK